MNDGVYLMVLNFGILFTFFFFQAEDGIRDLTVTGVQTCALPISSREDERGTLILSTFTGAARELSDALLVNPYDVSQLADSIHRALEMSEEEQSTRMQRMRHNVREHNIYRWAAHLLSDLTEIRIEIPEGEETPQLS